MRRLLIVLAVLIGLTALASGVNTRQPTGGAPRGTPDSDASATAPSGPSSTISRRISTKSAEPARIQAEVGDTVVLTVASPELDTVSVEGIGKIEAIDPQSPARIELYADTPGEYPIMLLQSERRIGTLTVEPAA